MQSSDGSAATVAVLACNTEAAGLDGPAQRPPARSSSKWAPVWSDADGQHSQINRSFKGGTHHVDNARRPELGDVRRPRDPGAGPRGARVCGTGADARRPDLRVRGLR